MRRAFIICGPPSSGNRLIGAILVRAGCWGEGSTNQPKTISDIPTDVDDIVWIHPRCWDTLISDLRTAGFEKIIFILVIREPEANCRSMVKSGFYQELDQAYTERTNHLCNMLNIAVTNGCQIEIVTYEGLSTPMLKLWLPRFGLPIHNLDEPLQMIGQLAPDYISNENAKHY